MFDKKILAEDECFNFSCKKQVNATSEKAGK